MRKVNTKMETFVGSYVMDTKGSDIILKLVNAEPEFKTMNINLSRFKNIKTTTEMTALSGDADAENTFENPQIVVPVKSQVKVNSRFEYTTPVLSLTVFRIETKK